MLIHEPRHRSNSAMVALYVIPRIRANIVRHELTDRWIFPNRSPGRARPVSAVPASSLNRAAAASPGLPGAPSFALLGQVRGRDERPPTPPPVPPRFRAELSASATTRHPTPQA